jgi:hypothetical protein
MQLLLIRRDPNRVRLDIIIIIRFDLVDIRSIFGVRKHCSEE